MVFSVPAGYHGLSSQLAPSTAHGGARCSFAIASSETTATVRPERNRSPRVTRSKPWRARESRVVGLVPAASGPTARSTRSPAAPRAAPRRAARSRRRGRRRAAGGRAAGAHRACLRAVELLQQAPQAAMHLDARHGGVARLRQAARRAPPAGWRATRRRRAAGATRSSPWGSAPRAHAEQSSGANCSAAPRSRPAAGEPRLTAVRRGCQRTVR